MTKYRDFTESELKWIDKFQKVMKTAPKTLFMFNLTIYPLNEKSERYMTESGGIDGYAPSKIIDTPMDIDGGDY